MHRIAILAFILLAVSRLNPALGHGLPILVGLDENTNALVVSQDPESPTYPTHVFIQENEDSDPFPPLSLDPLGPVIVWDIPGFNISGLEGESSLSIEILPRTVAGSDPSEERILWYWDSVEGVQPTPATAAFYLLGTDMRYATIAPPGGPAPPPFELAATLTGQQGDHNHGLMSYALDNSPAAATGLYGFYARLTASLHEPSNPFLLVFNYGVDYELIMEGALAIDSAAVDPGPGDFLVGDYNGNHVIDAADYTVWRDAMTAASATLPNDPTPGTVDQSDFLYWRAHFGQSLGAGANSYLAPGDSPGADHAVPEPSTWLLAIFAMPLVTIGRRRLRAR